jgi:hypothetical protein
MKPYNIHPDLIQIHGKTAPVIELGYDGRNSEQKYIYCPVHFQFLEATPPSIGEVKLKRILVKSTSSKGWIARIDTQGFYVRGANGEVAVDPNFVDNLEIVARAKGKSNRCPDLIIQTTLDHFWLRVSPANSDAYILCFDDEKVSKIGY